MLKLLRKRDTPEFRFDLRKQIVPIVADAAIADERIGDGRLVPLVILDTTNRPDLVDFFNLHEKLPPGDVDSVWAVINEFKGHISLILEFKKPFETQAVLNFDLTQNAMSVDLAIHSGAIYLQAGKPGDRLYRSMSAPRIIVELGADIPLQMWEGLWIDSIKARLRSEGLSRNEAKRLGPEYMKNMRDMVRQFKSAPRGVYVIGGDEE